MYEYLDQLFQPLFPIFQNQIMDNIMLFLTEFGYPTFWFILIAGLFWSGKEKESFFMANVILFATAITGFLKIFFARPRPEIPTRIISGIYSELSFPSGHAMLAGGYWGYFVKRIPKITIIIGTPLLFLVMYSRVYLGLHFPTDVIIGALFGIVLGFFLEETRNLWQSAAFKLSQLEDEIILVILMFICIIFLLHLNYISLFGILLGYYSGFFWLRHNHITIRKSKGKTLIKRLLGGYIGAGILFSIIYFLNFSSVAEFLLYFTIGVWITCIYPHIIVGK